MKNTIVSFEQLQRRRLLAHTGIDVTFNNSGHAPADASLLLATQPGGKRIAVGAEVVRIGADGVIDQTFVDRGADYVSPRINTLAALAGQQLFIAGTIPNAEASAPSDSHTIFVRKLNLKIGATNAAFGVAGMAHFVPPT